MDRYDVVITSYPATATLPAVQALQRILGLSAADAAALAGTFPCVVCANQDAQQAQRIGVALKQAGAAVELRISSAPAVQQAASGAGYQIGDLALDQPAPPPPRVQAAPPPVAPAPKPGKPGEDVATGNVQMLDDGFGGEGESGPALELDYETGTKKQGVGTAPKAPKPASSKPASAKPVEPKPAAQNSKDPAEHAPAPGQKYAVHGAKAEAPQRGRINVRDKSSDKPSALVTFVLPLLLVFGGAAAAYHYYGPGAEPAVAGFRSSERVRLKARSVHAASPAVAPPGEIAIAAAPKDAAAGTGPAPSDRRAPATAAGKSKEVMEWSAAKAKRERIHGLRTVSVDWPEGVKHDKAECLLLDTKYESKLDDVESTGTRFEPPPSVEKQLKREIDELQASKRYRDRKFVSLCLAN